MTGQPWFWFGLSLIAFGLWALGMITIGPWRRHR